MILKAHIEILWMVFGLLAFTACSNTDSDLEKKWQLIQYQYADGSTQMENRVFYNFQKGSFSVVCIVGNDVYETFFGTYSLKGDEISIILLPESVDKEFYDDFLAWPDGRRTFKVRQLTSSALCLEYEGTQLLFREY